MNAAQRRKEWRRVRRLKGRLVKVRIQTVPTDNTRWLTAGATVVSAMNTGGTCWVGVQYADGSSNDYVSSRVHAL